MERLPAIRSIAKFTPDVYSTLFSMPDDLDATGTCCALGYTNSKTPLLLPGPDKVHHRLPSMRIQRRSTSPRPFVGLESRKNRVRYLLLQGGKVTTVVQRNMYRKRSVSRSLESTCDSGRLVEDFFPIGTSSMISCLWQKDGMVV